MRISIMLGMLPPVLVACTDYQPRPIEPEQAVVQLEERSLGDPSLRDFIATNLRAGSTEAVPATWTLDTLTLAAFYFQPDLDVARAQWAVAEAGRVTAGQRPGIAAALAPGYNATTAVPSPRLAVLTADFTLETGGRRDYRIAQAAQLSEAARLNIASVAWQVRSRVRSSLLGLYGALESETLLRQQQAIHAENVRIVEGQYGAGAVSAFELTQARLAADSARLALRDAERRRAEALAQLAAAVGVPVAALDGVEFSFDSLSSLPTGLDAAEVRQQALLNRPDILGALAAYAASQSALQLEIARQYPNVLLGPGYEYDQGDNKWSLGVSVSLPANRNRGPIAEAQARRAEAAARFNALQASVLGQIDLAVAAFRAASQKQADASAMLADLTRQEGVARSMLEVGELSRSDLAAIQLQLSVSALARLDAALQAQQAAGQLEDAVQAPLGLASAVWEDPPQNTESTAGGNNP